MMKMSGEEVKKINQEDDQANEEILHQ